jgi:hypothetical protein
MNNLFDKKIWFVSGLFLCAISASAQTKKELNCAISYIASSAVYINAGETQHIAIGDTLRIVHAGTQIGTVVVTAISEHSSAANIVSQTVPFTVGDEALITKNLPAENNTTDNNEVQPSSQTPLAAKTLSPGAHSDENIVSGRAAFQYNGIAAEDSRFNLSQPAAFLRLTVQNLFGTGMLLTLYDRSYYDNSDHYALYGNPSGLKHNVYTFALQRDATDAGFGYGIGRMTSRYVGGMGTFDGFQFFYRYNHFTGGVLGGAAVPLPSSSFNSNTTKGSLFLNYHDGEDFSHYYDGTIAYARQTVSSQLDREFLYVQNSLSLGTDLSIVENSEIELNDIVNGVRKPAFKFSNTFLSINYDPNDWLSINTGYDAMRNVYLFETMKSLSDTLFDKTFMQGYRANATVRLTPLMTLSSFATYRTKKSDGYDSHTLGGTFRISDLFDWDTDAGIRYAAITGAYSKGVDFTADVNQTLFYVFDASLRYDYYKNSIALLQQTYTTQTVSADINYNISRALYTSFGIDDVFDATMNSYRFYAEMGIRF